MVHEYSYDVISRLTSDKITSFGDAGQNVDDWVNEITRSYDSRSRTTKITSWYDVSDTQTVKNEIEYTFNDADWGQLTTSEQEHDGIVTATSPEVGYEYIDGLSGTEAKYLRLRKITYPTSTRMVYNSYGSAGDIDNVLGRVSSIDAAVDGTPLAEYTYMGAEVGQRPLTGIC